MLTVKHDFFIDPPIFPSPVRGWPAAGELPLPCRVGSALRITGTGGRPLKDLERGNKMPQAEEHWVVQTDTGVHYEPRG